MSREQHRIGLLDRLLRHGATMLDPIPGVEESTRNVLDSMADAPAIIANNVVEYYYAVDDREVWNFEDFPNVAPPFHEFWIEMRHPTGVRSKALFLGDEETGAWQGPSEWGVAFNMLDRGDPYLRSALEWGIEHGDGKSPDPLLFLSSRWIMQATLFVRLKNGTILGPLVSLALPIEPDGTIPEWVYGGPMYVFVDHSRRSDRGTPFAEIAANVGLELIKPALLAISFMHCTNVTREKREPPRKLSHSWVRRGATHPLRRYEVLDIEPMKRTLATEGRSGEVGHRKSLHIARGHFRDYREGPGLFGRHHGVYWVESHARGSAKIGTVVKDYRVKQPQPEGAER